MTIEYGVTSGKVFPASKAHSLLEVGCGPGYFSPTLAGAVHRGAAALGDLQHEMLHLARERLATHDNARCVQLDEFRGWSLEYTAPFRAVTC